MDLNITLKDIISIIMFVFLLIVINMQANKIENLEDENEQLKLENTTLKDKFHSNKK